MLPSVNRLYVPSPLVWRSEIFSLSKDEADMVHDYRVYVIIGLSR